MISLYFILKKKKFARNQLKEFENLKYNVKRLTGRNFYRYINSKRYKIINL